MTADRDIERLLDTWFADGPMQVSDHVFDEAVERVYRQRQRPAWRLLWRAPHVASFKAALAAAAVVVVVVAGFAMLGGSGGVVGGVAVPPRRRAHDQSLAAPVPGGHIDAGDYVARPFSGDPMAFTVTVPEGWNGFGGWSIMGRSSGDPDGIGISFITVRWCADPCDPPPEPSPPPTARPSTTWSLRCPHARTSRSPT